MSSTAISTDTNGQPITGTAGTAIGNISQQRWDPTSSSI